MFFILKLTCIIYLKCGILTMRNKLNIINDRKEVNFFTFFNHNHYKFYKNVNPINGYDFLSLFNLFRDNRGLRFRCVDFG